MREKRRIACLMLTLNLLVAWGCGWEERIPRKFPQTYPEGAPRNLVSEPDGAQMVLIPEGKFQMGSNHKHVGNEKPIHTVHLDAYYLDKYEVTNAQFQKFLQANPQWRKYQISVKYADFNYLHDWNGMNYPRGKGNHPVIYVSWHAANAYAQWAGKRLPTEAEWEKAARGGLVGKEYPWGDDVLREATLWRQDGTYPVGSFPPNGYGLYDMAGNVWEWVNDWYWEQDLDFAYRTYYHKSPKYNPTGPSSGSSRILRGGAWDSSLDTRRCAKRYSLPPFYCRDNVGFRCAMNIP